MLVSRAVVAFLVVVALAACVRNPMPVAPTGSADGDSAFALPAGAPGAFARVVPEGSSGEIESPRWASYRAASRTVGGVEGAGTTLPREWRGLRVAEPARCAAFEPADYVASGLAVPRLRAERGRFREPLGCSLFAGAGDPAVHMGRVVPTEAAHDAGLCVRPDARAAFAVDPDNRLYLPAIVAAARDRALARGDGEWLPSRNLCWYVGTQLRVRRRYGLSVSSWEARLFEAVLSGCSAVAPAPRCDVRRGGVW